MKSEHQGYEWSTEGRRLLHDLEKLANSTGNQPMLAYHIISENPEYFREYHIQKQAANHLNGTYSCGKRRVAKRCQHRVIWSISETDIIMQTLNMQWKYIKPLLPGRTQGAVYRRRQLLRQAV